MNQISLTKVAVAVFVIFALSRARAIRRFINGLDLGDFFTLEPVRRTSEEGRCLITLALIVLAFFFIWTLIERRR